MLSEVSNLKHAYAILCVEPLYLSQDLGAADEPDADGVKDAGIS